MSRGLKLALWPVVLGAYVVAMVVVLAQLHPFRPAATAAVTSVAAGDVYRGETVYQRDCAGCHGAGGEGGAGPALVGTGLAAATVVAQIRSGGGIMPAALVTGQEEADVVEYVVQLSAP